MAIRLTCHAAAAIFAIGIATGWATQAAANVLTDEEVDPFEEIDPQTLEGSGSLWDFFQQRTRLAAGFNENYQDNYFLEDNRKQEELITTLKAGTLFADPRGSLLYGFAFGVNALRYHRLDKNALNPDFHAGLNYDTGGRILYHLSYHYDLDNDLLFTPDETDVLIRSSDFIRNSEHEWIGRLRYALNESNYLVPQVTYNKFDLQVSDDSSADRETLNAIIDWDHDLRPGWVVFGGYGFQDTRIPGDPIKNSKIRSLRLGTRYELTELLKLAFLSTLERSEFQAGAKNLDLGFNINFDYQAGPRTIFTFNFVDGHKTSFQRTQTRVRTLQPSLSALYSLTPLVTLKTKIFYGRQISRAEDSLTDTESADRIFNTYGLAAGLKWQMRESTRVTLDYSFSRAKTADRTSHSVTFGVETALGGD